MSRACIDCGSTTNGAVMVAQRESNSGPGIIYYACIDHARVRATQRDAPEWLSQDIAAFEAREAAQ